jgi:hypothetical protein
LGIRDHLFGWQNVGGGFLLSVLGVRDEAVDRFALDARWQYAAGGLAVDYPAFVRMVLVDIQAQLAPRSIRHPGAAQGC